MNNFLKQLQFECRFHWCMITNRIGKWFIERAMHTTRTILTDPWRPS